MGAAEKLQLVEELWDDLASSREPLPLPPWHREEAHRRGAELDAYLESLRERGFI